MTTTTKRCVTCKKDQPVSNFGRNKSTTDGLHRQCRDCRAEAYQAAKARKANGEAPRKRDDTITSGNPLSDPFTPEGWPVMMSVAASVAGRIYRQHNGWHPMSRADIESAAIDWVTEHRAEASRCRTEAMAVVKIAERVSRAWRKTMRPETPGIRDFAINVRDHEIMMDTIVEYGWARPGESVALLALAMIHQKAVEHPYIDAMSEPDRVSYDQISEWIGTWDRTAAGAPRGLHVGLADREVEEFAHESNEVVTAYGGRERDVEAIEAGRARHAELRGE